MKYKAFDSRFNIVLFISLLLLLMTGCAVNGEEEAVITVSPGSAVVTLGDTEQFSVTPAGTTVTWSVDGILGGNEGTVGKIDTAGKYTAPADADVAPEQVEITAADTTTGASSSATALLTTFKSNKQLTKYATGQFEADTYSSGQRGIAVYEDSVSGTVYVYTVWSDNSAGLSKIWFAKSSNGGNSFDDSVRVDEELSGEQFSPAITVDENGYVFIVWENHIGNDSHIYLKRYDNVSGFSTKKQIDSDTIGSIYYDSTPSIVAASGKVCIVWEHKDDKSSDYPNDVYLAWSDDLGDTFQPIQSLTVGENGRRSSIAMDSLGVAYVVWEDLDDGLSQFPSVPTHVKLMKVISGVPGNVRDFFNVASGYNARFPSLVVDPVCDTPADTICDVYVIWQKALISDPGFGSEDISSYSIDLTVIDGETLGIINQTLTVPDSGSSGIVANKAYPALAADDSNIYIVWDDLSGETKNVYSTKSSDGKNFTTKRIVNDDIGNNSSGISWHEKPAVAVANGKAYVIWTDDRNTQISPITNDVFFAVEQ